MPGYAAVGLITSAAIVIWGVLSIFLFDDIKDKADAADALVKSLTGVAIIMLAGIVIMIGVALFA